MKDSDSQKTTPGASETSTKEPCSCGSTEHRCYRGWCMEQLPSLPSLLVILATELLDRMDAVEDAQRDLRKNLVFKDRRITEVKEAVKELRKKPPRKPTKRATAQ